MLLSIIFCRNAKATLSMWEEEAKVFDENTPIVTYGPWSQNEYAMFERRCPKCGRLVKADETSNVSEVSGMSLFLPREKEDPLSNATCSRCGRIRMMLLGWTSAAEEEGTI